MLRNLDIGLFPLARWGYSCKSRVKRRTGDSRPPPVIPGPYPRHSRPLPPSFLVSLPSSPALTTSFPALTHVIPGPYSVIPA